MSPALQFFAFVGIVTAAGVGALCLFVLAGAVEAAILVQRKRAARATSSDLADSVVGEAEADRRGLLLHPLGHPVLEFMDASMLMPRVVEVPE